jgi:hypothetical protein
MTISFVGRYAAAAWYSMRWLLLAAGCIVGKLANILVALSLLDERGVIPDSTVR